MNAVALLAAVYYFKCTPLNNKSPVPPVVIISVSYIKNLVSTAASLSFTSLEAVDLITISAATSVGMVPINTPRPKTSSDA
jgi:hypothetical protein